MTTQRQSPLLSELLSTAKTPITEAVIATTCGRCGERQIFLDVQLDLSNPERTVYPCHTPDCGPLMIISSVATTKVGMPNRGYRMGNWVVRPVFPVEIFAERYAPGWRVALPGMENALLE
jgi:hypothetical protein